MISEKMYANHRAQNYVACEKRRYKHEQYLNNASKYREMISRNSYTMGKEAENARSGGDRQDIQVG
jgi:hypothetical protein